MPNYCIIIIKIDYFYHKNTLHPNIIIQTKMNVKILLTSESDIKKGAVDDVFGRQTKTAFMIECINCDICQLPPQPIDCGEYCTQARIECAKKQLKNSGKDFSEYLFVSIENDLVKENDGYHDRAHVRLELMDFFGIGMSKKIGCPIGPKMEQFESQNMITFSEHISGFPKTGGEFLAEMFGINHKNWMNDLFGLDRKEQITQALYLALSDLCNTIRECYHLYHSYRTYPNFPNAGVDFKYFYSLFRGENMNILGKLLQKKYQYAKYDAILPLESRGLVLATLLADRLKTTMIPFQKPGKIPGDTIGSDEYEKEYGKDEIKVSVDLFTDLVATRKKFYRFLITDDLVASGGTLEATEKILNILAKKFNFEYHADILVLEEVPGLRMKAATKISIVYAVIFRNINRCHEIIEKFY